MDEFLEEVLRGVPARAPAPANAGAGEPAPANAGAPPPARFDFNPPRGKADLVAVALGRRLAHTAPALWKMNTGALLALVRKVSQPELDAAAARQRDREAFRRANPAVAASLDSLKAEARRRGLACSAGVTADGLVDALGGAAAAAAPAPAPFALDEDQAAAVERWGEEELYIYAGPGAGKTTTVCALIARIGAELPEARVLALVFNREAERVLTERLRQAGVALIPKAHIRDLGQKGAAVLTFNKFGYWGAAGGASLDDVYGDADGPPAEPAPAPAPSVSSEGSGRAGFSKRLRDDVAAIRAQAGRGWTHLVLDEAQDIDPNHAEIVDVLLSESPHLVAAGDPRQEIYLGCTWFSRRLAAAGPGRRVTLRYNHRSSPAIVQALNDYSRAAFPVLHADQVATRGGGAADSFATVRAEAPPTRRQESSAQAQGVAVGQWLGDLGAPGGACYALAPVSIQRWHAGTVVLTARQQIYQHLPGAHVQTFGGDEGGEPALSRSSFVFATARKIKGTERPNVVVFGLGADYSRVVGQDVLAKLLFVALSRARDRLLLVLPARSPPSPTAALLAPLTHDPPAFRPRAGGPPPPTHLTLTVADSEEGLSGVEALPPIAAAPGPTFSALTLPAHSDADFVGLYLEALVAAALGAPLVTPDNLLLLDSPDPNAHRFEWADGRWRIVTSPAKAQRMREFAAAWRASAAVNVPYFATMIRFTARVGRLWTVSERLEGGAPPDAGPLARELRAHAGAGGGAPVYGATFHSALARHRAPGGAGRVAYVPDLILGGALVELKHVAALTDTHRRQAAVYAALRGAPSCLLLNMATGASEVVGAFPLRETHLVARAVVGARVANEAAIRLGHRAVRFEAGASVAVALDVESDGGLLTEVGAVAFSPETRTVLGAYHEVLPGAADAGASPRPGSSPATREERLTGLTVADRRALAAAQGPARARLHRWLSAEVTADACAVLHWGGSEKALVRPGDATVDVLHRVYRPWLGAGAADQGTTLGDAVAQLIPAAAHPAPHRAFEDAVGLMMAYIVLVDHAGVC